MPPKRGKKAEAAPPKAEPPKPPPRPRHGNVFVFGGRCAEGGEPPRPAGEPLATGERFEPQVGEPRINSATGKVEEGRFATWVYQPPMPRRQYGACAVAIGRRIYICGGSEGLAVTSNAVDCYDTQEKLWLSQPPMAYGRSQAAAIDYGGWLVVLGGFTGQGLVGLGPVCSAEVFDPAEGVWAEFPSMLQARQEFNGFAVTMPDERLFVAGGGGESGECLGTAEMFVPAEPSEEGSGALGQWRPLGGEMIQARRGAAGATVAQRPWMIGGHSGATPLSTIEVYDVPSGTWKSVKNNMEVPRYAPAAGIFEGKLWVCGGNDGTRQLHDGEVLSPATVDGEWEKMPVDMYEARSSAAYATVLEAAKPGQEGYGQPKGKGKGKEEAFGQARRPSTSSSRRPSTSSAVSPTSPKSPSRKQAA